MVFRDKSLYALTACFALALVLTGIVLLGRTALPTANVLAHEKPTIGLVEIASYPPGFAQVVRINGLAVIVWHRDEYEIDLALQQDDPALWKLPESHLSNRADPVFASDANLSLDHEWFFAWPGPIGVLHCIQLPQSGDYGGFYDPCIGDHYDLSGRFHKGIADANLTAIPAEYSDDGQYILLDLNNAPHEFYVGRRH
jgi:ubiquinol-cytochrome c reductase iron-sulfur subunit